MSGGDDVRWAGAALAGVVAVVGVAAGVALSNDTPQGDGTFEDFRVEDDMTDRPFDFGPDDGESPFIIDPSEVKKERYQGFFCASERVEGPSPRPAPTCTPPSAHQTPADSD